MPDSRFTIEWRDSGIEPKVKPNPAYPDGKDVDATLSDRPATFCKATLPYPARRIGAYVVTCKLCGLRVACTTAGRPDDPRSITMECRRGAFGGNA